MLQIVSNLKGYSIEAKDGSIGTVSDFLFDDSSLKVRWLVVDTGNWLTGRKVLIHPSAIGYADHWRRELTVGLTKSQVKDSPDIAQDRPVSLQMQNDLYKYYGWDSSAGGSLYGAGVYGGGLYGADVGTIAPPLSARTYFGTNKAGEAERGKTTTDDADPHLRSIAEVTGYHVHATDGSIGYVENFLIDSESWVVRYLTIDTSNWWFGQHVLISPHAVKEVDWTARYIRLDIARDQVKASPPWNPAVPIDEEFENRLYSHYDWPADERQSPV
ncbi:MAG: PRC-barrel domain-containing protein [Bradyrhizobium sp.]